MPQPTVQTEDVHRLAAVLVCAVYFAIHTLLLTTMTTIHNEAYGMA